MSNNRALLIAVCILAAATASSVTDEWGWFLFFAWIIWLN